MTIYIFTGPTLSPAQASTEIDAVFLPPVAQGDVDRLTRPGTTAIGIIDGYFERVPAVWHKELLFAMAHGIHVFGAASMGALRAVELEPFGMDGVGRIFEAFRVGTLTDDDEVAVAHAGPEQGYAALSEPMVNIRATMAAATRAGILAEDTAKAVTAAAKARFYPDRIWPAILRGVRQHEPGMTEEVDRLTAWLPVGRVDQKRDDAIEMLRRMRVFLDGQPPPKRVGFRFAHTDLWEEGRRRGSEHARVDPESLLEELALNGDAWQDNVTVALARVLAEDEARRHGYEPPPEAVRAEIQKLRVRHALLDDEATANWLASQEVDQLWLQRTAADDIRVRWVGTLVQDEVLARLPDELRRAGLYQPLAERAADKARVLGDLGLENPGLADTGLDEAALLTWWFGLRDETVPLDLAAYTEARGFLDGNAFRTAIVREWLYQRATKETPCQVGGGIVRAGMRSPRRPVR